MSRNITTKLNPHTCLSKKDLRGIFSFSDKPLSPYLLTKRFFPNKLMELLELSIEEYRKTKTFAAHHTRIIIEFHQIEEDDITSYFQMKAEMK